MNTTDAATAPTPETTTVQLRPLERGDAAAIHVYESLGFQREGVLVDEFFSDGRDRSAIRMCLFQHQALGSDDSRRDA